MARSIIFKMDEFQTIPVAGDRSGLLLKDRVAVLFHRFGPYHHARLNAAGRLMSVWGVEACGMEATYAWDKVPGAAEFTRVTLTDHDSGDHEWKQALHREMWLALEKIKPEVVVLPGWTGAYTFSALAWCIKNNIPNVVMSESNDWDERRFAGKEWIKRRLVRLSTSSLAGGTPHADYLAQLGMARERIFLGYDIVDNDYFVKKSDEARDRKLEASRRHGLPEGYFLASARFVEKKNLFRLIQAYARYRVLAANTESTKQKAAVWDLVLLGDGPLKPEIVRLISGLGLQDCIRLPGFKQYDELPAYFGLAGAFVHASTTEQWGLVVNEAMASGLPVLVSDRCGCAQDLVKDAANGFRFDPYNVEQLAQLMGKLSAAEFPLAEFGQESRRIISNWGPQRFATGLKEAVAMALNVPRPRAGMIDQFLLKLLLKM